MARLSFALYEAYGKCGSVEEIAFRLDLPVEFVAQRIEAARLSLLVDEDWL
jgi:hypothetical protein